MSFSIFTIASENAFLRVLAREVLKGFPCGSMDMPLSRWTILVPNRRSARALSSILLEESGAKAMLLPRIKPIGDIDEDLIADSLPQEGVADGISKTDHLHAILLLLLQWAEANPDTQLAEDVLHSGKQAFALATSLQQLVNQFETEDVDPGGLQSVYELDLAGHRQNILDLLKVVTAELPKRLAADGLIGPGARRNLMIRLEARRIAEGQHRGPVIAAGSTGTNPATRDLLKAIAEHPMGAVVLPGLDLGLDDQGWNAITPEHPQYSLRMLLQQWNVPRTDVKVLGQPQASRMWLMGQALRPADVADQWSTSLAGAGQQVLRGLENVAMLEALDRQQEAEAIALRLRQHIAESEGKAALMTPDRDLATRVKAALRRWNVAIDDSAGEPLVHGGQAALLVLLLRCVAEAFSSSSLFALLYQADCSFGLPRAAHLSRVRALELAGFRGMPEADGLDHLLNRLVARRQAVETEPHVHPLLKTMSLEMWEGALSLAAQVVAMLSPLADKAKRTLSDHVDRLKLVLDALSPLQENVSPADQMLRDVLQALQEGSHWHPVLPLSKTQHSIVQALARETLRPPLHDSTRLAIYGLAEARLADVELVILGGLTEGSWPDHPDTGPWLNRPMRDSLKLQQPERDIGVTAHDFVQAFGHPQVVVSWPRRLGGAPAVPSRWVLRLKAVMMAAGLKAEAYLDTSLQKILQQLDAPHHFAPWRVPQARPPVAARPTLFSVTRVETLVRDSYAIYARNILRLEPLDSLGVDIDARLRGNLIHAALQGWTVALPQVPESERLHLLLAKGEEVFKPYFDMPEVARFWWPRFVRMARAFIGVDDVLRAETLNSRTETSGRMAFDVEGREHILTARADRIDIGRNGGLRIVDYKSGELPGIKEVTSGFAPQLTLEAHIASAGGFHGIASTQVDDVIYVAVGGGAKGVVVTSLAKQSNVAEEAAKAFASLCALLAAFQRETQAYIPRHNPKFEDKPSDFDHLSRRLEWQLEGSAL